VAAYSALAIDGSADHPLAPQAEQRQRFEDTHVDLLADDDRDRRRSKQAPCLHIPSPPREQCVSRRPQAGEVRLRPAGDEAGSAPGSHTVNVLPAPGVLATVMWPPCSSAKSRAIARPSPLPPRSRLRD